LNILRKDFNYCELEFNNNEVNFLNRELLLFNLLDSLFKSWIFNNKNFIDHKFQSINFPQKYPVICIPTSKGMGKTRLLYSFIKEIFKRQEIISFFLNNNFEKEKERNLNNF
jgi:hypothetical protein